MVQRHLSRHVVSSAVPLRSLRLPPYSGWQCGADEHGRIVSQEVPSKVTSLSHNGDLGWHAAQPGSLASARPSSGICATTANKRNSVLLLNSFSHDTEPAKVEDSNEQ